MKNNVDGENLTQRYSVSKLEIYHKAGYAASFNQYESAFVDPMRTATSFLNTLVGIYYDTRKTHAWTTAITLLFRQNDNVLIGQNRNVLF